MNRQVLVVDDDATMVRTLRDILSLRGWEATGADSGESALEAVRSQRFRCVVMDIKMGGIDGITALRHLKHQCPGIPVVLMTAYTADELVAEALREGTLSIVPKPADVASVAEVAEAAALGGRSAVVVDDQRRFLEAVAREVAARGVETRRVEDLDDALQGTMFGHAGVTLLQCHPSKSRAQGGVMIVTRPDPGALVALSRACCGVATDAAPLPRGWAHAYLRKPIPIDRLLDTIDGLAAA